MEVAGCERSPRILSKSEWVATRGGPGSCDLESRVGEPEGEAVAADSGRADSEPRAKASGLFLPRPIRTNTASWRASSPRKGFSAIRKWSRNWERFMAGTDEESEEGRCEG